MTHLDNNKLLNEETLLSTANGYVGMRANFEEGYADNYRTIIGTYINGFYDDHEICYDEMCYGFPTSSQKMANVNNAQGIWLDIDGDVFSCFRGHLIDLYRKLDIKNGYAIRKAIWQSRKGHNFEITFKRMASFEQLELITIEVEIKSIDFDGDIKIVSSIDSPPQNDIDSEDPRAGAGHQMLITESVKSFDNIHLMTSRTTHSNLSLVTACSYSEQMKFIDEDRNTKAVCCKSIKSGESISIVKYIVYADSTRHGDTAESAVDILKNAASNGIEYYYKKQKEYLDDFWKHAYINVYDDEDVEYALNYSMYQLLSSAGKDEYSNICAKGLSGGGYEGHYFWDTEIYMVPFFMLTKPDIAKNLLKFRYSVLDNARKRTFDMGHTKGAKIPWRTINGTECSSYFPAGSAQYHINADVAYAIIQYYLFTKDIEMLKEFGYEVIYETARIWLEVGNYNAKGEFCINTVTGPDEYTAIVNNNYYTNSMAKYHLEYAVKLSEILQDDDKSSYEIIKNKLGINDIEIEKMKKAADSIFLPFDDKLNIYLQDDCFINRKDWDFKNTPKDKYPLLLHFHPLHIYRHKVLKQADTILSYVLLDNVDDDIMADSYNYYKQITTHDSSLSPCVHSIMAARIGNVDEAYDFFMSTIRLDLDDLNKNTKDGLHIANAGGAYMAMVYGFGGVRIKESGLYINPTKPKQWSGYSFRLNYKGSILKIDVRDEIKISTTKPTEVFVYNKYCKVEESLKVSIKEEK